MTSRPASSSVFRAAVAFGYAKFTACAGCGRLVYCARAPRCRRFLCPECFPPPRERRRP